jgi:hypothetical protein
MAVAVWTSFQQIADPNGSPYSGALVNVYAAGTTTPLSLFTDSGLSTGADNPIVCLSDGTHPMRYMATASYKTAVTTSAGAPLTSWSKDNIDPGVAVGSGALPVANGGTGSTTAGGARTNLGAAAESTVTALASDVSALQIDVLDVETAVGALKLGQCQLTKSGSNLLLLPFDGNKLTINSVAESVPDAGVTLAPGVVPTSNLEYIYAYMSGATMTLEYSTTAYATQVGTGLKIKSGDATRTLVGMAYATAGPVWVDSTSQRFVRSWYNDPGINLLNSFSANRTATSGTYAEVNSEIRIEFLIWTGENIYLAANGYGTNDANGTIAASIGIDGATAEDVMVQSNTGTNTSSGFSVPIWKSGLSEGYHYATFVSKTTGGTTTFLGSGTAGTRCTMRGFAKR